jgi:hypothetical protein
MVKNKDWNFKGSKETQTARGLSQINFVRPNINHGKSWFENC